MFKILRTVENIVKIVKVSTIPVKLCIPKVDYKS